MIDGKESKQIVSYIKMYGEIIHSNNTNIINRYIYYMINGHVFFISLLRSLKNKVVCFGDYTSYKNLGWQYSDYK